VTNAPSIEPREASAVLFYDGECGLCNHVVRLLLRIDRHQRPFFSPLQGKTAQSYLRARGLPTEDFDSMIFVPDWAKRETITPLFRTDAGLAALRRIGGVWRVVAWLRVVPRPLRDSFYRIVARLRYRIFGRYVPRPFPHPEWAQRILP